MTPRFWHRSLSASHHVRKYRQNNITRYFAVVMPDFNQEGRLLQHRKLFRQDIQEWRGQMWLKGNETRKTEERRIKRNGKRERERGWREVCVCMLKEVGRGS